MGYSPTEYAEFTEPPAEMSSHGFLLRRVWHLAILTPPAMGYSPTEYAEFTEPPAEKSLPRISQIYTDTYGALFSHRIHRIHRICQRVYCRDAIPSYICAHPCHLWEALLCQKFLCVPCVLWESLSSHGFLLRRVWHLAIPTPPAMGYSPTEYAELTEPPAEMSSRRFLLRRVWHLAIPTPPAMGYSPTEFTEYTEPPTEMSSHGFHRFTQILMVRCSPTEFTEFTEFGSVGMAG
ncbi:hypothetical protein, partial [Leyella stercorea]|uniref:hypothetical protein n=1 Tax=Leyella stercorea TaxID=363265 RepID=UPI00242B1417